MLKLLKEYASNKSFWIALSSALVILIVVVAKFMFSVDLTSVQVTLIVSLFTAILSLAGSLLASNKQVSTALSDASNELSDSDIQAKIKELESTIETLTGKTLSTGKTSASGNSMGIILDSDGNIVGTESK